MALDAATLALTAAELKTTLTDAKIAKLFEPTTPTRGLTSSVIGRLSKSLMISRHIFLYFLCLL